MAEKLVNYDPIQVLEQSRAILEEEGCLPLNCPKKACLSLRGVNLVRGETIVRIDSNPPQLPTTNPKLYKYELDPICEKHCHIFGNNNRGFEVRQDSQTGEVISAKGQWLSDRH